MSSPPTNHQTDDRWNRLFARKLELETVQAFRFFRAKGIEPILIKGWAAARNYPQDSLRFYTDIDLSVASDEYQKARHWLASAEGSKIAVDLHWELKQLDTRPWADVFADSVEIQLDGYPVRIPSAEDHLRILAVHWLNDGGERKDRLLDIYHAIRNLPPDFNWDRCLETVSKVRRGWVIAAIGLTGRYFELDLTGLPIADEARNIPNWLSRTVEKEWKSGVRHRSLHTCLNDPREFVRQLGKRLPPNPIQATIEQEGDFNSKSRFRYQIASMRDRLFPSLRGLFQMLRLRSK